MSRANPIVLRSSLVMMMAAMLLLSACDHREDWTKEENWTDPMVLDVLLGRMESKDYRDAERLANRYLESNPYDVRVHILRGQCRMHLGKPGSEVDYDKAFYLASLNYTLHKTPVDLAQMAHVHRLRENWAAALALVEQGIQSHPEYLVFVVQAQEYREELSKR